MKLNELATITAGYPFRGKMPESSDSGIFAIQMKDLAGFDEVRWSELLQVDAGSLKPGELLQQGEVLFAARGNHYPSVVLSTEPPSACVCAPYFFRLKVTSQKITPEFLCWYLNQPAIQRILQRGAEGSVSLSVKKPTLSNLDIAVPPLEKQQQILRIDAFYRREKQIYSQLIANNEKIMNKITLDLLAQSTKFNKTKKE